MSATEKQQMNFSLDKEWPLYSIDHRLDNLYHHLPDQTYALISSRQSETSKASEGHATLRNPSSLAIN
jgi:hypothetical protein